MGRRIIREDEVDTTAEVAKVFQKVFDNQYILETKIEQLQESIEKKSKKSKKSEGSVRMKTLISLVLTVMLAVVCFGAVNLKEVNHDTVTAGDFDQDLRKWFGILNADITNAGGISNVGTGKTFYLDSGAGNSSTASGTSPASAWPTLNNAIDSGAIIANRGDRIIGMQGHNEALTLATSAVLDIAGVTLIAADTAVGSLAPTFDFDAAAGRFEVGADNVNLIGLRFRASTNTILRGVYVVTGTANTRIINCDFVIEGITDEFATAIEVVSTTGTKIIGNTMDAGAASAVSAIDLAYANDDTVIANNFIHGDYSTANIIGTATLSEDLLIQDNILWNGVTSGLNTEPVLELLTGTVGITRRNYAACNVATVNLVFIGDSMLNYENFYNESQGSGSIAWQIGVAIRTTTSVSVTTGSEI